MGSSRNNTGGLVEDRPRHHEALGHAAREGVDGSLGEARQLKAFEQIIGCLSHSRAGRPKSRPW